MLARMLWSGLLAWVVVGNGAMAADTELFPDEIDRASVQQTTARYSCLAQCTVRYIHTRTGATNSKTIDVGPATVTVGTPSEDAIHAAAQVALATKCPTACQDNIPAGNRELSCRLSGTGPCSRVH